MSGFLINLLMVEDDPAIARLLMEMLVDQQLTFRVTHVMGLREALQQLAQRRFGLVLLDLTLPDSMGSETLKRISPALKGTPFIVLTGVGYHTRKASRAGAYGYLVKGAFTAQDLAHAVRGALQQAGVSQRSMEGGTSS